MKVEFEDVTTERKLLLRDFPMGEPFTFSEYKNKVVFIKVYPNGCLTNSKILSDIMNRGDCLLVNLRTGNLFYANGNIPIEALETKLTVSKRY